MRCGFHHVFRTKSVLFLTENHINQNNTVLITCLLEHAKENRVWVLGGISIFRKQSALTTHSDAVYGHSMKTPSPVVGEGGFSC